MLTPASSIAFIGFGDVGRRLAVPFTRRGVAVRAHDPKQDPAHIEAAGADPASMLADALRGAKLVIAVVDATASAAFVQTAAPLLSAGQIYLDLSNASTTVHGDNAARIERSGAIYVAGHAGHPLLLAGARAAALAAALETLGCSARAIAALPQCCAPETGGEHAQLVRPPDPAHAFTPLRRGELP